MKPTKKEFDIDEKYKKEFDIDEKYKKELRKAEAMHC
jgi:hypothetical protein